MLTLSLAVGLLGLVSLHSVRGELGHHVLGVVELMRTREAVTLEVLHLSVVVEAAATVEKAEDGVVVVVDQIRHLLLADAVVVDSVPQLLAVRLVLHLDLATIDGRAVHHALADARVEDDTSVPDLVEVPVELDDGAHREDVVGANSDGDRHVVLGEQDHEVWHGAHERDGETHGELSRVDLTTNALELAVVVDPDDGVLGELACSQRNGTDGAPQRLGECP